MTAETLKSYSIKDLSELARKRGVEGYRSMRKEQLVKALMRAPQRKATFTAKAKSSRAPIASSRRSVTVAHPVAAKAPVAGKTKSNGVVKSPPATLRSLQAKTAAPSITIKRAAPPAKPIAAKPAPIVKPVIAKPVIVKPVKEVLSPVARRLSNIKAKVERLKNLAANTPQDKPGGVRDRLVVMVRDPYWLHAHWELSRQGVTRAQAAIGQEWHCARPILRLLEVSEGGTTSAAESVVRDIEIHGGVSNWYVDVQHPPKSYRLDIGYLAPSGKMFVLARSNVVNTPKPGVKDAIDENWSAVAEDYEKIYAMSGGYNQDGGAGQLQELFEERLRRPMGSPMVTQYGSGADALMPRKKPFNFELDAELIVYGVSEPDAHVTLQGDPVKLRSDGTFTVRFSLPNCRQVIPAVACSANGLEQRTIVLAVERNTKVMEPLVRDANE